MLLTNDDLLETPGLLGPGPYMARMAQLPDAPGDEPPGAAPARHRGVLGGLLGGAGRALENVGTRVFGGGDASAMSPQERRQALADAMFSAGAGMVEAAGGPRSWGEFAPSPLAAAFAGIAQGRQSYRQAASAALQRRNLAGGTGSNDPAEMRREVQRLISVGEIDAAKALAAAIPDDQSPWRATEGGLYRADTGEFKPFAPGTQGLTWDQRNKVIGDVTNDYNANINAPVAAARAYGNLDMALRRMAANPGTNERERTATGTVILKAFAALANPAAVARMAPNATADDIIGTGAISGVVQDWFAKYIRGELSAGQTGTIRQAADDLAHSNIRTVNDAIRQARAAARARGISDEVPLFNPWGQYEQQLGAEPGRPATTTTNTPPVVNADGTVNLNIKPRP